MSGITFEINRPVYGQEKKIKSTALKVGDRFIYEDHQTLFFKTNSKPKEGKYLCCSEGGDLIWLDGELRVLRLNGVVFELAAISNKYIKYYNKK